MKIWNVSKDKVFEAIKNGPHFYCVSCLRGFFKEQVIGLSENIRNKQIVQNEENVSWLNDIRSIDDGFYVCRTCHGHLSGQNLPKLAVANGNKLPVVPDF